MAGFLTSSVITKPKTFLGNLRRLRHKFSIPHSSKFKFMFAKLYVKFMKKILVTGGAGFIGSNLIPILLNAGNSVTVYDNLSSGKIENLKKFQGNTHFKFVKGDIRDYASLMNALSEIDAVVHLAALIDVSASVVDPIATNEINVDGTLSVLQASKQKGVSRFVFASSTAVYGDAKILPINEETVVKPISPYAASKAAGESYCNAFSNCYNLQTIALRFFNVYGPRNENSPYSGVITKFLRKATNNEPLTIEGDGEQTRDFIHVSDIAFAIAAALEAKELKNDIFNVCTGFPTSINKLAETVKEVTGRKNLQVIHAPPRVGDIRSSYGDASKTKNKLGFVARVSLRDGLQKLLTEM
jgi:UDP-glucose 4-epimerase